IKISFRWFPSMLTEETCFPSTLNVTPHPACRLAPRRYTCASEERFNSEALKVKVDFAEPSILVCGLLNSEDELPAVATSMVSGKDDSPWATKLNRYCPFSVLDGTMTFRVSDLRSLGRTEISSAV